MITVNKSPLNYGGSKDRIIPNIIAALPPNVSTFIDAMGGAGNVCVNVPAAKVLYNELHPYVFSVMEMLFTADAEGIIAEVEAIVSEFGLEKKNGVAYNLARDYYNKNKTPELLYTLHCYCFQSILRFNSRGEFNASIGNNGFTEQSKKRIREFKPLASGLKLKLGSYQEIDPDAFDRDSVFYFDPPYLVTTAAYNDGKRGFVGWGKTQEAELLDYLTELNRGGKMFLLSNTLEHKGVKNEQLVRWVADSGFRVKETLAAGTSYPRTEVLVGNY